MDNPLYNVNISWVPKVISGQTNISIGGATQSVPSYTDGYFLATMPELNISATSDTYRNALNALLVIATASTTKDPGFIPPKRTW